MYRKPFSKELYEKYDNSGRNAVRDCIIDQGQSVLSIERTKGVNLVSKSKDNTLIYFEVEVKRAWDRYKFPFNTIHIPYGKRHVLKQYKPSVSRFYFSIVSNNFNHICFISHEKCSQTIGKEHIYSDGERELFYEVPVSQASFYDKVGNKWIKRS